MLHSVVLFTALNEFLNYRFVEAYQKQFGKLAFATGRRGSDLQEIFSSSDRFFVSGIKPSTLLVNLKTEESGAIQYWNHAVYM